MVRCIVYLHNNTQQVIRCIGFSGSDWYKSNPGLAPPYTQGHAVGAMDCPSEHASDNWGWLFFEREFPTYKDYFQIYFLMKHKNDCGQMGAAKCTKDDADNRHGVPYLDGRMPSDGRREADKMIPGVGLLQWRPADMDNDPMGFDGPVMWFSATE